MAWYLEHLSGEKAKLGGADAIWTQQSWLLFNKVKQAPPYDIVSPLFHIGWGAEDMKAEFERQIKLGTTFSVALTDAVELFGTGQRDRNFFMYLYGPDHVTIEVQSANHHNFMHVHMLSDDPVAAADWYVKHLGLMPRNSSAAVRAYRGIPTGPLGWREPGCGDVLLVPDVAREGAVWWGMEGSHAVRDESRARARPHCVQRRQSGSDG